MADLTAEQLLEVVRSACASAHETDPARVQRADPLVDDPGADCLLGDVVDRAPVLL